MVRLRVRVGYTRQEGSFMEMKDWIAVVALCLGVGNTLWQVYVHRDRKNRDAELDQRQKMEKLELKYLEVFREHRGLGTWKAKAYEAHDDGLSPETVKELLERVWIPFHQNPVATHEEILNPILGELRARKRRKMGDGIPAAEYFRQLDRN